MRRRDVEVVLRLRNRLSDAWIMNAIYVDLALSAACVWAYFR